HWLKQMDFTYRERPVFTRGWRSKEGLMPSDYWRRNMFVEFMEDDLGIQMRDTIGVDNMLWGSDFPHAESTWPKSSEFLTCGFTLNSARPERGSGMLEGFVPVTRASELPPGSMKWVVIDRDRVLVANVGGSFYALRDVCGHAGAPLSTGELVGYVIECPLHYACFDIRTGKLLS